MCLRLTRFAWTLSCFASAAEASSSSAVPNAAAKSRDFMKTMELRKSSALPAVVMINLVPSAEGFLIDDETTVCAETRTIG